MDRIVIKRDAQRKAGLLYLLSAVVSSVIFWFLRDYFVKPYGTVGITLVVILEYVITGYTLLMSRGCDILDPEGITSVSPFGSRTRLWSDLKEYEIGWQYGSKSFFGFKNQKIPYIRLVFTDPRGEKRLPYGEDADRHIRRYWGMPDRDTWTEQKK